MASSDPQYSLNLVLPSVTLALQWFDSLPHWDLLWLPLGLESGPRYGLTLILNTG